MTKSEIFIIIIIKIIFPLFLVKVYYCVVSLSDLSPSFSKLLAFPFQSLLWEKREQRVGPGGYAGSLATHSFALGSASTRTASAPKEISDDV